MSVSSVRSIRWLATLAAAICVDAGAEPGAAPVPEPPAGPANAGFDRYQVILDRQPFGAGGAAEADAAAAAVSAADSFARSLRLCSLARIGEGPVRAGLVDSRSGRTLALELDGEAIEGIRLTAANLETWEATLQRDSETVLLKLQGGAPPANRPGAPAGRGLFPAPGGASNSPSSRPASSSATTPSPTASGNFVSGPPAAAMPTSSSNGGRVSYAERRRMREEQRMAELSQQKQAAEAEAAAAAAPTPPAGATATPEATVSAAPERLTGEALQKHLQDYQMELIRTGQPPLPIPLTPEMDAQLVREGVLPEQPPAAAVLPDAAAAATPATPTAPPMPQ